MFKLSSILASNTHVFSARKQVPGMHLLGKSPEIDSLHGKEVLQALVWNHQEDYLGMQVQEHEALIWEFKEPKATILFVQ